MANNRLPYNPGANPSAGTAAKVRSAVSQFSQARQMLDELCRVLNAYGGDFATLGTDLGLTSAQATTLYNLCVQAQGDVCTLTTGAYAQGAPTGLRQLVDALA